MKLVWGLVFGVLWLLSCSGRSWADERCPSVVAQAFREAFPQKFHPNTSPTQGFYFHGNCNANIQRLLAGFRDRDISLEGMTVLYIRTKNKDPKLDPRRRRSPETPGDRMGFESEWMDHFVLRVEGNILDFDYTNEPTITPLEEYFENMFYPPRKYLEDVNPPRMKGNILLTVIPAVAFLLRHGKQVDGWPQNFGTDAEMALLRRLYPNVLLEDYLRPHPGPQLQKTG